jgi:GntR family transcriptional regulator, histidine utilization repressor
VKTTAQISFRDIKADISRRIAEGAWPPGTMLPGEEALAREFGAARATVNRALQELARSGLVERRRRAGTRVALNPVREARFLIPLVRREIEARGAAYGYALLSRETRPAPEIVRARLALPPEPPMLHLRCLHLADRMPYQFEDRWISLDAVPAADLESFETVGPNEWLVANAPFSHAEFIFMAQRASKHEGAILEVAEGEAVFVGERLTWVGDKPVTLVRMVHPPSHRMVTRV